MLVLSRKVNERIQIGDEITITIVRVSSGSVRVGIEAPHHFSIVRDELAPASEAVEERPHLARPLSP